MEEQFDDIDIIDKYLSGGLNQAEEKYFKEPFLNDSEFKKEVELYQKIYEGIEKAGRDNLKKKLDVYYDEYADAPETDNVRSINWRRNMYFIGAIAAASCAFFVIFKLTKPDVGNAAGNGTVVVKPSPGNKPAAVTPKDTGVKVPQPQVAHGDKKPVTGRPVSPDSTPGHVAPLTGGGYAMSGQMRLPAAAVRKADYPQALSYTFNQGTLTIYGDPLLRPLYIDIFKNAGRYYLQNDDSVYEIVQTNTEKPLVKLDMQIKAGDKKSPEKINLVIAPLKTNVYGIASFAVTVEKIEGSNKFYFSKGSEGNIMVLLGDFSVGSTTVVNVKKEGLLNWYVLSGTHIYIADGTPDSPAPLRELFKMDNSAARMFAGRGPLEKPVLML